MQTDWISPDYELPELGEEVIVFTTSGRVTALSRRIRYEGDKEYSWGNAYGGGNAYLPESILYWQSMPEAPPRSKSMAAQSADMDRTDTVNLAIRDLSLRIKRLEEAQVENSRDINKLLGETW